MLNLLSGRCCRGGHRDGVSVGHPRQTASQCPMRQESLAEKTTLTLGDVSRLGMRFCRNVVFESARVGAAERRGGGGGLSGPVALLSVRWWVAGGGCRWWE